MTPPAMVARLLICPITKKGNAFDVSLCATSFLWLYVVVGAGAGVDFAAACVAARSTITRAL
jgi:hypothetical protein